MSPFCTARRPWPRRSLALALLLLGCGPEAPTAVRHVDLVTAGALVDDPHPASTIEAFCADETHFSVILEPGTVLSASVTVEPGSTLVVGGCLDADGGVSSDARLDASVRAERIHTLQLRLDREAGWWRRELSLRRDAGPATVTLRFPAAARGTLYLRDVYIRHPASTIVRGEPTPTQVLLISVDTLRQDALGALGGDGETPNLDALIAESEVFATSYAAAGWTKPAHGTLLTGHHPRVHQAYDHDVGLHPGMTTLADRFQAAGFTTAALLQDIVHLDARFGFDRGFDTYRTEDWNLDQMARWVSDWIVEHEDRPFFFFFHTFQAHSDFARLPYEGPGVTQAEVERRFGVADYGCVEGHCGSLRLARINRGEMETLPGEDAILRYLYAEGVRAADERLGAFFDTLRAHGLWDDLLVVVTSDHGELFGEHGELLHGSQWEPVLRVPLIVKWPRGARAGQRTEAPVSAVDVAATLLLAADLDAGDLPGRDLRAVRRRDHPIFAGAYSKTLIRGNLKLTSDEAGRLWFFDLEADPDETRNLYEIDPERSLPMQEAIRAQMRAEAVLIEALDRRATAEAPSPLSEEERARLRALGYLDSP